ncbi:MAG TPA: hypothetical protein PLC27_07685 [Saprospiraceae bacterium]|jgi:hypothetical protein|nr:hypothetical protein [Saprospiraceae bacterium]MBK8825423.1 hypothetical protein [Saprospiraceae bacterium]HMT55029.1 hypothetical protein [Saprospiraceae bacterium]HMT72151.1 hypothetical protein [Saprospiraceae bacterium]HQV67846.1 hypothetical protein [Saprospiraceae bacterium]
MRKLIILMIGIGLMGCSRYDYNISKLKQTKISFDELPDRVKSFYKDPSEFKVSGYDIISLVSLDENENFSLETIDSWIGPWVAYDKLIDGSKNISYRIDYGKPFPYVVFDNKLYLTDKFNVFTTVKDYSTLEFTRYELK